MPKVNDSEKAKAIAEAARVMYADNEDILVDEDAEVEEVEGGYWVAARVWVYDDEVDNDE